MFQNAFQTGKIVLPRYSVEGNTRFRLIQDDSDNQAVIINLEESIDLVEEVDSSRLQIVLWHKNLQAGWMFQGNHPILMKQTGLLRYGNAFWQTFQERDL